MSETLSKKLGRNPRASGAPQSCLDLEVTMLLDQVKTSAASGMPLDDVEINELVEAALNRLENDARIAAASSATEATLTE